LAPQVFGFIRRELKHEIRRESLEISFDGAIEQFRITMPDPGPALFSPRISEISRRRWEPATENHSSVVCQQFALKHCDLFLDHAIEVQLTTASKSKVLRQIRECFRV
jgi:hypothetical protein